jgi:predicted CXXCH cytochrome family protein
MRRSIAAAAVVIAAAILLLVGAEVVLGLMKDVSGTKHDVATPGVSPCLSCHLPRDPEGQTLWASDPNSSGAFSGQKPLCFSCHDGTVTATGSYVFESGSPEHLSSPGLKGQDCDRCHDPHETGYGKFIKLPGGANFCQNCHPRAGPSDHPIDVDSRAAGIQPADSDWDPNVGDFSGTRLWDMEGTGPGNFVKCLSCHSPHGGEPDTLINTLAFESSHESFLTLCQNCHYGWGAD